jgi:hypothetical protein
LIFLVHRLFFLPFGCWFIFFLFFCLLFFLCLFLL